MTTPPKCRHCHTTTNILEFSADYPEEAICPNCCGQPALGHVWTFINEVFICNFCGLKRDKLGKDIPSGLNDN